MKIILAAKSIYPFHPFGGVQKYVYYLAKFLTAKGVKVEIVAPSAKGCAQKETFEGIPYTFLPPAIYWFLEYPIGWLGVHLFSKNLAGYLKTQDFDLLHSFDMTGFQYLNVKHRKPVISQIFTDNFLTNAIGSANIFNLLPLVGKSPQEIKEEKIKLSPYAGRDQIRKFPIQYHFKVKPIHHCLRQSEDVFLEDSIYVNDIVDLYRIPKGKCHVVPVGTDIAYIRSQGNRGQELRNENGFSSDEKILLTVNRLAADKGIDKIILAVERIKDIVPEIRLVIIGRGYQEQELYSLIRKKNLQKYVRHFKDVPEDQLYQYYHMSDIYISAFSYPGSSVSTLEAMACGLPIITTAQPWLVQEGQNGKFLEKNSPELIEKAVIALIQSNQLKEKGKLSEKIVTNYDWNRIADIAIERYQSMASANQKC